MRTLLITTALCALAGWAEAQAPLWVLPEVPPDSLRLLERVALSSPYDYQRLGMFCKLDVQLEKRLKLPVLFRLGDARHVEALEGKGPLYVPIEERP